MILVPLDDESPVVLNKAVIFFGRSQECDIVLANSRKVSRKHCCVAQIDDTYLIRDLGSTNGVRVNNQRADPELKINVGDEVWIGDVGFRLETANAKGKVNIPSTPEKRSIPANGDVPVPIPKQDRDFIVEESIQQKIIDNDAIDTFD